MSYDIGPLGPTDPYTGRSVPQCSAPDCRRAATKRSPDFDLIWCADCAGPMDLALPPLLPKPPPIVAWRE